MRKRDVQIGGRYTAKIAGNLTVVRITGESQYGGWQAVNERTGRAVRIKSAAKLRSEVGSEERRSIAVQREREASVDRLVRRGEPTQEPPSMTIGIPYAYADVTAEGIVHTCPVCGERCVDPPENYDEYGEQTAPSAYQDHYAEKHASEQR
jgi:hypothetical protein